MIHVFISPAKNLNEDPNGQVTPLTYPELADHALKINETLRKKKPRDLEKLQGISNKLADLNWSRNQSWQPEPGISGEKPAATLFNGEVYQGLNAHEWSEENWNFANQHLTILSGLYGALRPADRILPYRLEMGTPLKVSRKKNLYDFWKGPLSKHLKDTLSKDTTLIDLSSTEYFRVIRQLNLPNRVIEVKFLDRKNDIYKPIQFWMKKARGTMASWIIRNEIHDPSGLIGFDEDGYFYSEERSNENQIVFLRDEQ